MSDHYAKAGVNIDEGNRFVDLIRPMVGLTRRSGVIGDVGGFGGLFRPALEGMNEPLLVSGTDGVGTKVLVAEAMSRFDTIGQDLVAMCINDIACSGAEPLFFLDYFATGELDAAHHARIIEGIAAACKYANCALLGGETAEMPGVYQGKKFDLAGFAVGIVDRPRLIDGKSIAAGDTIIGIASSGFHSNGYSLVRKIVEDHHLSFTENLLTPTFIYSPLILLLMKAFSLKGIAHITGGGFWDNIPRILPDHVSARIKKNAWEWPTVMRSFQQLANLSDQEMLRVWNCGIGLVMVVSKSDTDAICQRIEEHNHRPFVIGQIEDRASNEVSLFIE
ncbi:MAG: phosphoribosylformylglycinamidine cyclo-ligase [Deltaproteobacteria bacterium]|nr:phosphoribosylformylglycinamidine cyclo-ligase [Deltaproteobacteria bacterium]